MMASWLASHPAARLEMFHIQDKTPLTNICNHPWCKNVKKRRVTQNLLNSIIIDRELDKKVNRLIEHRRWGPFWRQSRNPLKTAPPTILILFISLWRHVGISPHQMPSILQYCDPHQRWPWASILDKTFIQGAICVCACVCVSTRLQYLDCWWMLGKTLLDDEPRRTTLRSKILSGPYSESTTAAAVKSNGKQMPSMLAILSFQDNLVCPAANSDSIWAIFHLALRV